MSYVNLIPENFFVTIPASIYDFMRYVIFFVFRYNIIGPLTQAEYYTNPFNGYFHVVSFSLNLSNLGGLGSGVALLQKAVNLFVDVIESIFDIELVLTFFDILTGPVLFLVLLYAFIKYIIPVS